MAEAPDVSEFAASVLHLIQRFTGNQPDALAQMRQQLEAELRGGREMVARAEAQLAALDQLESLIEKSDVNEKPPAVVTGAVAPSLKRAILTVLDEEPERIWDRDHLLAELARRGWAPQTGNRRNTFTSRLRDLEKETKVRRIGRDGFTSIKNEGVLAM